MYGQAYICYLDKLIMEDVPTLVVPSRDDFIDVGGPRDEVTYYCTRS